MRLSKLLVSRSGHRQFGTPPIASHMFLSFTIFWESLLQSCILYAQTRVCLTAMDPHLLFTCYDGGLASSTAIRHLAHLTSNSHQVLTWVCPFVRDLQKWVVAAWFSSKPPQSSSASKIHSVFINACKSRASLLGRPHRFPQLSSLLENPCPPNTYSR